MNLYIVLLTLLIKCALGGPFGSEEDTDLELINEFLNSGKSTEKPPAAPLRPPSPPPPRPPSIGALPLQKPVSSNEDESGGGSGEEVFKEPKSCECVKYYLCNIDNGTVVDNGDVLGLIDIRLGASKPSPCPHYFDICCPDQKQSEAMESQPPKKDMNYAHTVCGKRNDGGVGFRITGAENQEAQFGEFPWMAAIVRQEQLPDKPTQNIYLCGGSLIHPQVVATAAHCLQGREPSELKVRLGEWDTQTPDELYPHQDRYVDKIVIHEAYYSGALFNDIALLFLSEPATFAPNVDTICLPPANSNFDGQTCFASGWGKNSFGADGKYQVILKKVDVPVVPVERCQAALKKTRLGVHFKLHPSFVCAGGEAGRDTCKGDGGSPLVCQLPDSPYFSLYGIVSWGIGCGEQGNPGVYASVPKFVRWITEQMQKAKMDTNYFKVSS